MLYLNFTVLSARKAVYYFSDLNWNYRYLHVVYIKGGMQAKGIIKNQI